MLSGVKEAVGKWMTYRRVASSATPLKSSERKWIEQLTGPLLSQGTEKVLTIVHHGGRGIIPA